MPDALAGALATDGLWLLFTGALLAGITRGFTGFGSALVYLPFAARVVGPFEALTTLITIELFGPLINLPRAVRDGQPADVARLALGAVVAVPAGVWVLSRVAPESFRWGVSSAALILLALLVAGVRYRGVLTRPMVFGTGALGGFLAGSVGLPGPPVIMLYMASSLPAKAIRANLMLYLFLADVIMLAVLGLNGFLVGTAFLLGALAIPAYAGGNWLGARLFRPEAEKLFRRAAYAIIAASALMGLPLWD